MINLLPPEEKQAQVSSQKKKVVVILGITLIIPLVCLVLALLSLRFYLLGEINSENITLEQAKLMYQTPDFLAFQKIIQTDNAALALARNFYVKQMYSSQALETITNIQRPEGVFLTNLSLAQDRDLSGEPTKKFKVTLTGKSLTRDNLLLFQKSLQETDTIEDVYFSPDSWVKAQNTQFYVTFQIHEKPVSK